MPDLSIKAKFWKINNHLNNGNEKKLTTDEKVFVLKTLEDYLY